MHGLAILSDIHSNLPALEAVLDDLDQSGKTWDQIVINGDVISLGPYPQECLHLLRQRTDPVFIMGNNDRYISSQIYEQTSLFHRDFFQRVPPAYVDNLRWTASQLSKEDLDFIRTWPNHYTITLGSFEISIAHGTPSNDEAFISREVTDAELISWFPQYACNVFSHTHEPFVRRIQDRHFVNTGSVGLSTDGDPRSSYVILTGPQDLIIEVRRVLYDVTATIQRLQVLGVPWQEALIPTVQTGLIGTYIGRPQK
jgi:predicted phosphodiesterase